MFFSCIKNVVASRCRWKKDQAFQIRTVTAIQQLSTVLLEVLVRILLAAPMKLLRNNFLALTNTLVSRHNDFVFMSETAVDRKAKKARFILDKMIQSYSAGNNAAKP